MHNSNTKSREVLRFLGVHFNLSGFDTKVFDEESGHDEVSVTAYGAVVRVAVTEVSAGTVAFSATFGHKHGFGPEYASSAEEIFAQLDRWDEEARQRDFEGAC